jgi:hypothetical protein
MHASIRNCLPLALLVLAACSSKTDRPAEASMPATVPAPAATPATASASVALVRENEQKCTDEPRVDENDRRPRCGGMGTPPAEASHAYRIALDNGESFTACDISKPFSGKIGRGMVTMSFTPADDDRSGKVAWHFANARGMADTAYDYTLDGPEEKMTGAFRANSEVCGKAAGMGACAAARKQTFTSTWTRIDACDE